MRRLTDNQCEVLNAVEALRAKGHRADGLGVRGALPKALQHCAASVARNMERTGLLENEGEDWNPNWKPSAHVRRVDGNVYLWERATPAP